MSGGTYERDRHGHLSIGEVLGLLQSEFPDVTISKIRFLESQGLIDPERTPSGYRKFYDADIERLRWILTQQRDHFLPLKVIKDRLDEANALELPVDAPTPQVAEPAEDGVVLEHPSAVLSGEDDGGSDSGTSPIGTDRVDAEEAVAELSERTGPSDTPDPEDGPASIDASASVDQPGVADSSANATGRRSPSFNVFTSARHASLDTASASRDNAGPEPAEGADGPAEAPGGSAIAEQAENTAAQPAAVVAGADPTEPAEEAVDASDAAPGLSEEDPAPLGDGSSAAPAPVPSPETRRNRRETRRGHPMTGDVSSASFTDDELAAAVGLTVAQIAELERFGLLRSRATAQGRRYGDDALIVARLALRFLAFGIEARHLRMFRVAADRELALYEQVTAPLNKAGGDSREVRAGEIWAELDELGASMRDALFRHGIF